MAQQKKKTTTTKKKTTGSSRSSASGKRTAKKNQKRPIRREVAGAILLVLALCLGFSYFQSGAWLLDQSAKLCRSLFGWGYYLVAPALLLGSYILLFHRGRNVTACVVGAALLPVLLWGTFLLGPVMAGRYIYPFVCALPVLAARPGRIVKEAERHG